MSDPTPPSWVRTPDGRLEPFDADRIARSLFAAGATINLRDPFLCRELTDGVVHFLATDGDSTPSVGDIAEIVSRTVRELGQPSLARAYEQRAQVTSVLSNQPQDEGGQPSLLPQTSRAPNFPDESHLSPPWNAINRVYAPDVWAAHECGLIELFDRHQPDLLAGTVVRPDTVFDGLQVAGFVAIDGLEYYDGDLATISGLLSPSSKQTNAPRSTKSDELHSLIYLNLNVPPPSWTEIVEGPLFTPVADADRTTLRLRAVERLAIISAPCEWHVGESDLSVEGILERVASLAIEAGRPIAFPFDRPRRPVVLGGGLNRQHTAIVSRVGVNLIALAEQPGMLADEDRYCQRLGSLARLAVSAAVQKREHLRHQNRRAITDGFRLDRARFVAVALGLDEVVRRFTGWSMANGGPSLNLGRRISQRLVEVLRQDGRALQLETFVDGLSPDAPAASIRGQIQAAGTLHAIAEGGTLRLHLPHDSEITGDLLADELRRAWRETAVGRVELVRTTGERRD
ncbi:MAG: hypothetical protein EBV06_13170 [Planctomycetia bacterium]|nr:hypothetical protein [Planctomycetia bacterium]